MLAGFLKINGDLRKKNNQYLMELAKKSSPELMFKDAFQQLGNSQVEAKFADTRTYIYKGKDVDQQVHLGLRPRRDRNVPIVASQRGIVSSTRRTSASTATASSSTTAWACSRCTGTCRRSGSRSATRSRRASRSGRSGMTGLAGGDHLHFTMLVGGQQVTPVDWWSPQWMQDRVLRKIIAAWRRVIIIEDSESSMHPLLRLLACARTAALAVIGAACGGGSQRRVAAPKPRRP